MRRLLRWLWNGLSVLSLLLFVATVVLWVRSDRRVYRVFLSPFRQLFIDFVSESDHVTIHAGSGWPREADGFIIESHAAGSQWPLVSRPPIVAHHDDLPFRWGNRWFACVSGAFYCRLHEDGSVPTLMEGGYFKPEFRLPTCGITLHDGIASPVLLVLPGWWLVRHRRPRRVKMRRASGLCPSCGYDLRANTSGICPECGAAVPAKLAT